MIKHYTKWTPIAPLIEAEEIAKAQAAADSALDAAIELRRRVQDGIDVDPDIIREADDNFDASVRRYERLTT